MDARIISLPDRTSFLIFKYTIHDIYDIIAHIAFPLCLEMFTLCIHGMYIYSFL